MDLASAATGLGPGAHTVAIEAVGTGASVALKVFVDDTLYLTYTDSSPNRKTGGLPALLGFQNQYAGENEPYWTNLLFQDPAGASPDPRGPVAYLPPSYVRPVVPTPLDHRYIDAQNGNDNNPGTQAQPWKSFWKVKNDYTPGRMFHLAGDFAGDGGSYFVRNGTDGATADAWQHIVQWEGKPQAIVYGNTSESVHPFMLLGGAGYVYVEGIKVGANNMRPFHLDGAHHVHFVDCEFVGTPTTKMWNGSVFRSTDVWLDGCEFGYTGNTPEETAIDQNDGDSVVLDFGSKRCYIVRNQFGPAGHTAVNIGGDPHEDGSQCEDCVIALNTIYNPWTSGVSMNGRNLRCIVEWNTIRNTGQLKSNAGSRGGILVCGVDSIVRRNTIVGAYADGIKIQSFYQGGRQHEAIRCQVMHNTIVDCGGMAIRFTAGGLQNGLDLQVKDNLVANNLGWGNNGSDEGHQVQVSATVYFASDAEWARWYTNRTWDCNGNRMRNNQFGRAQSDAEWFFMAPRSGFGEFSGGYSLADAKAYYKLVEASNVDAADPLFTNAAGLDFTLQAGSPARDAGVALPGYAYAGSAPDVGRAEYVGA